MEFDVQIARGIKEVEQTAWDHLGGERPFVSYRWYCFNEAVFADDQPIYVILSLRGEPIARATFWLKRREDLWMSPLVNRLLNGILARWPLLCCRSPAASVTGLVMPDDPQRRAAALRTVARVAQDIMREHRASFLTFEYLEPDQAEQAAWPNTFGKTVTAEPGTSMPITWSDFDAYINSLSYKTRKNYRRYLRAAEQSGIEITQHPTVEPVDEAMALIRNVEERYGEPSSPWKRRLLENAGMVDAIWLAARSGGRLAGCELMLGDKNVWLVTAPGRNYDFQNVYFLLSYADIRCAIERGAKLLRWGACTYDVKQRFGFRFDADNHIRFMAGNALLNRLGRWVAQREELRATEEQNRLGQVPE